MSDVINDTAFINLPLVAKGKVRNVYDLGDKLLLVTSDRISAFDVVFSDLIPNKGKVLNGISEFWFNYTQDIVENHLITTEVSQFPQQLSSFKEELQGRAMLVKKVQMVKAECIVRGYLTGSGWKEYQKQRNICGIALPEGLLESEKLPEPLFTPTTKAEEGHDENITVEELANQIGKDLTEQLKEISITLYLKASSHAESRGLILADTKFEFGLMDGKIILADEIFTPDSSRFWAMDEYEVGRSQKSFDKQYLRDYLEAIGWDKNPPAPALPLEVVRQTEEKYIEAYERITGQKLTP